MSIYFLGGLGVDKRIFQKVILPPEYTIHHIDWMKPLYKESMNHYAKRLSEAIDQTQPFILVGLSFGGMMAVEMNQFIKPQKTILISSAATAKNLPPYFKFFRLLQLHKIVLYSFFKKSNRILDYFFGTHTKEEKNLFSTILKETEPSILKWSIEAILTWESKVIPENLVSIHGSADKILPIRFMSPHYTVSGGGHFMVYNKAKEISSMLQTVLSGHK